MSIDRIITRLGFVRNIQPRRAENELRLVCPEPPTVEGKSGISHRVPWKHGILRLPDTYSMGPREPWISKIVSVGRWRYEARAVRKPIWMENSSSRIEHGRRDRPFPVNRGKDS